MRRIFLPLLLILTQPVLAAEPIEGTWLTPRGAVVSIEACAAGFCLINSAGETMGNLSGGGGHYEGTVINPDTGKSNAAKIEVAGDTLTVSGCLGVICASRDWTRQ